MKPQANMSHSMRAISSATRWMLAGALLSATLLGAGCGESADEPVYTQTSTQQIFQSDLADTGAYTLKTNAAGGLYLVCNTGADIDPHTLSPAGTAELTSWLESCLAELSVGQGGPMSESLIDRCVDQTASAYASHISNSSPDRPFNGGSHQTKADIKDIRSTAGRFWLCTAELQGFENPLPMPNENSAAFRQACKDANGTAPIEIFIDRVSQFVEAQERYNPCPDIDFNSPKQDKNGLLFECASNHHVISQVASRSIGGLEAVMDRCPGQEISEQGFGDQSPANGTTIYGCTSHGQTTAHSDGFGAFLEFEAHCTELGGQAYSRELSRDNAEADADYLCTANGDLHSNIESVNDYSRARASCALQGGSILTTNPPSMRGASTVGRDGRGDKVEFAREPHKGVDQNGQLYVICMPGADITECSNASEFKAAWHDCINSGRQPTAWSTNSTVDYQEISLND